MKEDAGKDDCEDCGYAHIEKALSADSCYEKANCPIDSVDEKHSETCNVVLSLLNSRSLKDVL